MFHPVDHPLKRGWVGRIDGEHVVQLAAQNLQAFFTGGASAREHAVYPLAGVYLLAPVLRPPSIRIFEDQHSFAFANPAAIMGQNSEVEHRAVDDWIRLNLYPRLAAIVGGNGEIAGFTIFADWRAPELPAPKDRDFAFGLGPIVVTLDEALAIPEAIVRVSDDEVLRSRFEGFDWRAAQALAAEGTALSPGDVIAGPALGVVERIEPATVIELEVEGLGTLSQSVHPPVEL